MEKPLSGIKVIELSTYVAAPGCARMLAEMGAEVIKIEAFSGDAWRFTSNAITRRGDEESPVYEIYNIGKRSICINIKDEKGLELLMKMLDTADIFITNTRLKSLKKLGLDADTITAKYPRLIYASLDGYGDKGPDANTPGFDTMAFWSRTGFVRDMSVVENEYPVGLPTSIGDCVAGTVLAMEVLTALYQRTVTGKGCAVKATLYGTAIWVMSSMILQEQERYGRSFPRSHKQTVPTSKQYKCSDGEWVTVIMLDYAKFAGALYRMLGIEKEVAEMGVTDYGTMVQHRVELSELMASRFALKTADEWTELFRQYDLVGGKIPHFADVNTDEQAWANGFLEHYTFRNGETGILPVPPINISTFTRDPSHYADLPGEHTDDVLREYGYSEEEVAELHARGAVK